MFSFTFTYLPRQLGEAAVGARGGAEGADVLVLPSRGEGKVLLTPSLKGKEKERDKKYFKFDK